MKKLHFSILVVVLSTLASLVALSASAQTYYYDSETPSEQVGMTVEWGVQTGVGLWDYCVNGRGVDGRLGWQVGGSCALNWGLVALQPEIHFVHHSVPLAQSPTDPTRDILLKSNSVEVPILLSVRPLDWLRLNVGPVITALNKCKFESVQTDIDFGRVRSTVGYAAGAGVTFGSGVLLDVRYNGTFKRQTVVGPAGNEFRVQGHAVWISVGYIFN